MKKLEKLKLTSISEMELEERQLNALKGGNRCGCGCNYVLYGGSTIQANYNANVRGNHPESYGGTYACGTIENDANANRF